MNLNIYSARIHYLIIFAILLVLTIVAFRKTLGLSLYGDDWLVISKYFANYGPGRSMGYFDTSMIFSNYGPQYFGMAIIYKLFGSFSTPYFVVNLSLRAVAAFSIYFFTAKLISSKVTALLASAFFTVSFIGSGTTDWVYNMNSYFGIAMAMVGLTLFVTGAKIRDFISAWFLIVLGYYFVIIRLYILPFTMFFLELSKYLSIRTGLNIKRFIKNLLISLMMLIPFLFIKILFPGLGFQNVNSELLTSGFSTAASLITAGKVDWIFTPFTSVGTMIFPEGMPLVNRSGLSVYPLAKFIVLALILLIVTLILIKYLTYLKNTYLKITLFLLPGCYIILLKLISHYQTGSLLHDTVFFIETYIGMLFVSVVILYILDFIYTKDKLRVGYFVVGLTFLMSFFFPWLYNPGSIMEVNHRYNIVPSVGMSLLIAYLIVHGRNFTKITKLGLVSSFRLVLVVFVFLTQLIAVNHFFNLQHVIRPRELNDSIYTQLRKELPELPKDRESFFYFDIDKPGTFGQLIGFGFPFHMQLVYNIEPPDDQTYPFAVDNMKDLVSATTDLKFVRQAGYRLVTAPTPIDHIFAFKLRNGVLTNITGDIRSQLAKSENVQN